MDVAVAFSYAMEAIAGVEVTPALVNCTIQEVLLIALVSFDVYQRAFG